MSLALLQNLTAICPNIGTFFTATGGTAPYTYSVLPGGAGGNINSISGFYTAPSQLPATPQTSIDTIQVTDSAMPTPATATATILVGSPIELVCDILRTRMGLDANHVYLWDQKINQPTDSGLYIAVSNPSCKPFASVQNFNGGGSGEVGEQSVNMMATLDIDIISRGPAARDQKELVLMALYSVYAEQQQEANNFFIGRLPA